MRFLPSASEHRPPMIRLRALKNHFQKPVEPQGELPFDPFRQLFFRYHRIQIKRKKAPSPDLRIPKIVHQVWIGDRDLPQEYVSIMNNNKQRLEAQGFQFKLYGNTDIKALLGDDPVHAAVYNKIPAYDSACRKDWLITLLLYKYGGTACDCSIHLNDDFAEALRGFDYVFTYPDFGDQLKTDELPPHLQNIKHAIVCCYNLIACVPKSEIFKNLVDKFVDFEINGNHKNKNAQYMNLEVFPDTSLRHGWMTQVHINEEIAPHLSECVKNNVASNSIRLVDKHYFTDIDSIPFAFYLKYFVLGSMTRQHFLDLTTPPA
jgi:hypothetical protein